MAAVDILFNKLAAVAEKGLAVKLNTPAVCPLWDLDLQIRDEDEAGVVDGVRDGGNK